MGDVLNRGTRERPRWYCRYCDLDGKRRQKATHQTTRAAAQRYLAEMEARIARGQAGIVELTVEDKVRRTVTVAELYRRFLEQYAPPTIKDLRDYRAQTRAVFNARVLPALGKRAAASIGRGDVEQFRDALAAKGYAAGSIRWTLSRLSKLYTWAKRMAMVDCDNPVSGVEQPKPVASLDYLSRQEVAKLLAYTGTHEPSLQAMVAFCVFTGARKGEAFGARWSDEVLEEGRVDINRSYELLPKSGKARHVPLHPELARILGGWRAQCPSTPGGLVFSRGGCARPLSYRPFARRLGIDVALVAAGCHLPAMPWHALRHTFASHAVMSGLSLYDVQRLLGHASIAMTER